MKERIRVQEEGLAWFVQILCKGLFFTKWRSIGYYVDGGGWVTLRFATKEKAVEFMNECLVCVSQDKDIQTFNFGSYQVTRYKNAREALLFG